MSAEIDIGGVFVPTLLAGAGIALLLAAPVQWLLRRAGVYRWVWHRGLFDLSLLVLIWGAVMAAGARWWPLWTV